MKKALRETQTLHAGCSKVEPKILPRCDPFLGVQDGQNLISWRWSLPLSTNPVWWGSMHAISSYHSNRPTNTHSHTHKQTHRQDWLQYTAPQLERSVNIGLWSHHTQTVGLCCKIYIMSITNGYLCTLHITCIFTWWLYLVCILKHIICYITAQV